MMPSAPSAAESLQIEVVDVGLADPMEVARQRQQLTVQVGAERLLQPGGER